MNLRKELEIPHKLSEVIDEKDLQLERLCKMALERLQADGILIHMVLGKLKEGEAKLIEAITLISFTMMN